MINDFNNSQKRKWMLTEQNYYEVENDIFKRRITRKVKGTDVEETYKANNKLAHSKYKKIRYL